MTANTRLHNQIMDSMFGGEKNRQEKTRESVMESTSAEPLSNITLRVRKGSKHFRGELTT